MQAFIWHLIILKLDFCGKNRYFDFSKLCAFFGETILSEYRHLIENLMLYSWLLVCVSDLYNEFWRNLRKSDFFLDLAIRIAAVAECSFFSAKSC